MNKIPCDVVRDLLVLYEDNVCSEESRQLIEEHIAECEECKEFYEMAKKEIPVKDAFDETVEILSDAFKKLQRKLTAKRLILSGLIMISVLAAYMAWGFLQDWVNIVPSKDIQITELYELENGDIYCTLQTEKPFFTAAISEIKVPEGYRSQNYDKGWHEIYFQYPFPFRSYNNRIGERNTLSIIFPLEDRMILDGAYIDHPRPEDIRTHTCETIYYKSGFDDKLVIWEKGWKIEPAPKELEEKIAQYEKEWDLDFDMGSSMLQTSHPEILWTASRE